MSIRSCYGTEYPDWKTFARYFKIDIPVGEEGAIRHWAMDHVHRDEHTIQSVMDFAKDCGHLPLLNQLEKLIKGNNNNNSNDNDRLVVSGDVYFNVIVIIIINFIMQIIKTQVQIMCAHQTFPTASDSVRTAGKRWHDPSQLQYGP